MSSEHLPFSDLASRVEALLFAEGDSLSLKKLAQLLECDEATLATALDELRERRKGSGLALVQTEKEVALAVAPETRDIVAATRERDQEREIGDAGLEVLGVLLYEGASTRSDIDYIRGVNSSSTIRNLLYRGLIDRTGNPDDGREFLYRPTVELLAHLGVAEVSHLPDYSTLVQELNTFKMKQDVFDEPPKKETDV